MPAKNPLTPLFQALRDLTVWFREKHIPSLVIGGVAVSLLGRPRATRDIDTLVLLDEGVWGDFLVSGRTYGFVPRLADALIFAKQSRVLLLRHQASEIDLDISFGALPFEEEAIERGIEVKIEGLSIPVPHPEDLIVMKAVAHRPRDMADIEGLLDVSPNLDLKRASQWISEFAEAVEFPEIYKDFEKILTRKK